MTGIEQRAPPAEPDSGVAPRGRRVDAAQRSGGVGAANCGSVRFALEAVDRATAARAGKLDTPHGEVETPAFMPVGTHATVKALTAAELREIGVRLVLANAYHLYLRPGVETIGGAGGLHRFMGWEGPLLTDSGGYQVFSLAALCELDEEGVTFRSHLDGSLQRFTPEVVVDAQRVLGSDIAMPLDVCLANPTTAHAAREAMERTLCWLERSVRRWRELDADRAPAAQALFGIVQGSTYADLRRASARATREFDLAGVAIGGLAVGEPNVAMYEMLEVVEPELDRDRVRYLMGVGFPEDLIEAVRRGMDLFDCVAPTRHGRNGTLFTAAGRINIRGAAYRRDHGPVDPECACAVCRETSRAYLSHLFHAREILGLRLATYHNVYFLTELMRRSRSAVLEGRFGAWAGEFLDRYRGGSAATAPAF